MEARIRSTILRSNIYSTFLENYMINYKTSFFFILMIMYPNRDQIIYVPFFDVFV